VAAESSEVHSQDRDPEPPKFEAKGRPPHDSFADGEPIVLRLFPDYTGPGWLPLWPSSDDTDALVPTDLLQRLIAWHDVFQQNFDYDQGWTSQEIMDGWVETAAELVAELRVALGGKARLEVDLWPLPRGNPSWKTQRFKS
jgi:hypothetical protein